MDVKLMMMMTNSKVCAVCVAIRVNLTKTDDNQDIFWLNGSHMIEM